MKIHELKLCESWINLDLFPDFAGLIYAATLLDNGRIYTYRPRKQIFIDMAEWGGDSSSAFSSASFGRGEEILKNYNYLRENLQGILILSGILEPTKGDFEADISIRILDDGKDEVCGKIKQKYSYEGDL